MSTVTISADVFHRVAALAVFASTYAATPILHGVQLSIVGGELRAAATDRYVVATLTHPHADIDELPAVVIPAKTLADVAKLAKRSAYVSITEEADGSLTFDYGTGRVGVAPIAGNYPPVARFTEGELSDIPAGKTFDPNLLARLAKLTTPGRSAHARTVHFMIGAFGTNFGAVGDHYRVAICPRSTV